MKLSEMCDVIVGLDVHLKKTQVTIMRMNGEVVKKERVERAATGIAYKNRRG